jgi:HAD superfamily hydrolase (TIGR01509 family)
LNKITGVIFDLDGTLAQTGNLIFATFNHISEKYLGKSITPPEVIAMFGPTEEAAIRHWINHQSESAIHDFHRFYRAHHKQMAKLHEGMLDVLKLLKKHYLPLGICTGKGKTTTAITLDELGITDYFDFVVTGDDVAKPKPSPEGIQKFLEKFQLQSRQVIMVGDSLADIKAAQQAGVVMATVVWDSYTNEDTFQLKSDFVFHRHDELYQWFGESLNR